jgi:hypothetical protein
MIVPVGKDGGGNIHAVAQEAAGWVAAAIDLGVHVLNYDSFTTFGRFHRFQFTIVRGSFNMQDKHRSIGCRRLACSL